MRPRRFAADHPRLRALHPSQLACSIADYLKRLERDRRLADMEAAAKTHAADPEAFSEALQISESFLPGENEALAASERSAEYKASRIGKAQKKGKR